MTNTTQDDEQQGQGQKRENLVAKYEPTRSCARRCLPNMLGEHARDKFAHRAEKSSDCLKLQKSGKRSMEQKNMRSEENIDNDDWRFASIEFVESNAIKN
uniref:Uncharacterized protein n=1 Tax=Romanomermis culicivorax TaxID=13658 RepID=A0A915JKR5_ROMCU